MNRVIGGIIVNTYGVNELRKMFLDYFESKGHLSMKSFSLVPHNDNSLLLINSGMAPLKPYFTGQEIPPSKRVTTCQKCIRTGDIENIGKTARHGTFFEMLGNFSFGDYFKKEAIAWTWEFLTEVVGLDKNRLYPSIYEDDEEAFVIWKDDMGIAPERIFRFGKADNFWEHGSGPCGPCSEVYYDRGEKYGCDSPDCTVGCECDRYIEVWNNVFTQFDSDGAGNYAELEQKNIDTGMGLERLAAVVQDVDSIFDVDTIVALRNRVCELAGKGYKLEDKWDVSIRIVTDHIRSATFMISDGIMPTNEGRGYVLRRIIRRAARHGRLLGIEGKFLANLCETVIQESKDGYDELPDKQDFIFNVLTQEENKFNKTIDQGLTILGEMAQSLESSGSTVLSGEDAFKLHDTYGFPLDLTKEILEEKGCSVEEEGFRAAMEEQKEKARSARKETNYMGADATVYEELDPAITSEFVGYESSSEISRVLALTTETEVVDALTEGEVGTVIVEETPFYATMGGQHADVGMILTIYGKFQVEDTIKLSGGKVGHVGRVISGMIDRNEVAVLKINEENRQATCKNHSATHLLQKALREVIGSHVEQAGSYVTADRLRFDFSHFSALSQEELDQVEHMVNDQIGKMIPVVTKEMGINEAKEAGAMALFGEKYGETVRVVQMGDFSTELCGGTHVTNTGSIVAFKIVSESGVAAGVRRIEALTGSGVFAYYREMEERLETASKKLKASPSQLVDKIEHLLAELKSANSELESLKSKAAKDALGNVMDQVISVNGVSLLATSVVDVDMNGLRELGDQLKDKVGQGVVVLASSLDGKVNLIAMVTEEAMAQGAHAGNLIKGIANLVGGGGGGRPNMAQAGGKNPSGIPDAIGKVQEVLAEQLK